MLRIISVALLLALYGILNAEFKQGFDTVAWVSIAVAVLAALNLIVNTSSIGGILDSLIVGKYLTIASVVAAAVSGIMFAVGAATPAMYVLMGTGVILAVPAGLSVVFAVKGE